MSKKDKEEKMALTTGNEGEIPTEDEKINAVGADVPTVPAPETAPKKAKPKSVDKSVGVVQPVMVDAIQTAAILFLAGRVLAPPDFADFKAAYPSLFE